MTHFKWLTDEWLPEVLLARYERLSDPGFRQRCQTGCNDAAAALRHKTPSGHDDVAVMQHHLRIAWCGARGVAP